MTKPAFLITIDTEGDNLWQNHDRITTENTRFLPRFQALCENTPSNRFISPTMKW